jgi:carotenoid cleavage dioxygenase-like enzyme
VTLTVDMNRDLSECVVFRANDVGRGPIAHARLPERIASGTHSCWASIGESGEQQGNI